MSRNKTGDWLPLKKGTIDWVLKEYNTRPIWDGAPSNCTWPSVRWSAYKKTEYKNMTDFIIKFKRRERWKMLKANLGSEYLERVHEEALMILGNSRVNADS